MDKPTRTIFIASSSDDKGTARMIVKALLRCNRADAIFHLQPVHWENSEWRTQLNESLLNALVEFPKKYNYGCFLFTPSDTVISKNISSKRVRDNVIFEFGLFASQDDGLKKAFIIQPIDSNLKLADDLAGIITARYHPAENGEALEVNITDAVETVYKAVEKFEKEKIERSDKAVKSSIAILRDELKSKKESQHPEIILSALRNLAEIKAQALNQTAAEVLNDILTWTNTILDIIDADDLAKLQSGNLDEVWVYSSMPLELNLNLPPINQRFKHIVIDNLKRGVKYKYFFDSEKTLELLYELGQQFPGRIEAFILDPYCVTSNYVIHFYSDKTISVYQNIVRRGVLESLVKLDKIDADIFLNKIISQFESFDTDNQTGSVIVRKKKNRPSAF